MRIFLVRHGESVANIDQSVYLETADHSVPLSPRGHKQAAKAGKFLKKQLERLHREAMCTPKDEGSGLNPDKVRLWTSPYLRAQETSDAIMQECGDLIMDRREDILLCEQQFGLFDGIPDEELPKRFPEEHAHYDKCERHEGKFWARMPLGESRFDVALRTRIFFGTIQRDADKHGIDTVIIVCHGVTLRMFVQNWCHFPYTWGEKERNPANCAIRMIDGEGDCGYIFEP